MDPDAIDPPDRKAGRNFDAEVTVARSTLETARSALDRAVAALPGIDGGEALATPSLLLLLFGVVRAKEHLSRLEALKASHFAEA
jgi:hypothetical protein